MFVRFSSSLRVSPPYFLDAVTAELRGVGGSPRALSRRGTRASEHGAPRRIMRVVNARLIGRWGGELSGRSIQR